MSKRDSLQEAQGTNASDLGDLGLDCFQKRTKHEHLLFGTLWFLLMRGLLGQRSP